jgi:hypothetical protein
VRAVMSAPEEGVHGLGLGLLHDPAVARSWSHPGSRMGCSIVASISAMCDWDSSGQRSPFIAGVHKGPTSLQVCATQTGVHAGMCRQVHKQGCKTRRSILHESIYSFPVKLSICKNAPVPGALDKEAHGGIQV